MRSSGAGKELRAEFVGQAQGTLVLTSKRLIFVRTGEKSDDIPVSLAPTRLREVQLIYSDVDDLDEIPASTLNLFVTLSSITKVKGNKGGVGRPSLRVEWSDDGAMHACVFTEVLTGRRKRNLNDWAQIIENLIAGKQALVTIPEAPSKDTLEGRVMHVMADMQEKGLFTIEGAVEKEFGVDLDPDNVQEACDRLSSQGLLIRYPEPNGDVYYRRRSPLGEADPSS